MDRTEAEKLFAYAHLPTHLQVVSQPFHDMAMNLFLNVPDHMGRYRTKALWKLWEAKNLAVAAVAQQ